MQWVDTMATRPYNSVLVDKKGNLHMHMNINMQLEHQARLFAIAAHDAVGQRRKYTGEPYWYHTQHVAKLVSTVPHTPEMLAAAHLHDVVEDTAVTVDTVREHFGGEVAELVDWLTNKATHEDGNRAARKALDRARLARAPEAAQTIKLADIISNIPSIAQHDPKFGRVYVAEKMQVLAEMVGGAPALRAMAQAVLSRALQDIDELELQSALKSMETR